MTKPKSTNAYSVAEALVAAPWLHSVLTANSDNGNADLLQRTNRSDELPEWPDRVDHLALEREVRQLRGEYVAMLCRAAWRRLVKTFGAFGGTRSRPTYVRGRKIARALDAN